MGRLNCVASSQSTAAFCLPLLFPIAHHSPPLPSHSTLTSFFISGQRSFCFQYSIHIYIQEEFQWIPNFNQWCEFTQLLLESFPSVITSSPSLPVNERDESTVPISFPHSVHYSRFCHLLRHCASLSGFSYLILFIKKQSYSQTDGDHPGSSPKHVGVNRPKREAHLTPPNLSVEIRFKRNFTLIFQMWSQNGGVHYHRVWFFHYNP